MVFNKPLPLEFDICKIISKGSEPEEIGLIVRGTCSKSMSSSSSGIFFRKN